MSTRSFDHNYGYEGADDTHVNIRRTESQVIVSVHPAHDAPSCLYVISVRDGQLDVQVASEIID